MLFFFLSDWNETNNNKEPEKPPEDLICGCSKMVFGIILLLVMVGGGDGMRRGLGVRRLALAPSRALSLMDDCMHRRMQ